MAASMRSRTARHATVGADHDARRRRRTNATLVPSTSSRRPTSRHAHVLEGAEIEGAVVLAPDELQRRLAAGVDGVVDVVDRAVERSDRVEPPEHVQASVRARHPAVAADGEGDLATVASELVGELHAGGRGADDEDAAVGDVVRTSVSSGIDLVDRARKPCSAGGQRRTVAPSGGYHDIAGPVSASVGLDHESLAVRASRCTVVCWRTGAAKLAA